MAKLLGIAHCYTNILGIMYISYKETELTPVRNSLISKDVALVGIYT